MSGEQHGLPVAIDAIEELSHEERYTLLRSLIIGLDMCGLLQGWSLDDHVAMEQARKLITAKINWIQEGDVTHLWMVYTRQAASRSVR